MILVPEETTAVVELRPGMLFKQCVYVLYFQICCVLQRYYMSYIILKKTVVVPVGKTMMPLVLSVGTGRIT